MLSYLQIVEWLKMDEEDRPTLLQLYMEEPDGGGHTGGPDSQEVRSMLFSAYIVYHIIKNCINNLLITVSGLCITNFIGTKWHDNDGWNNEIFN